MLRSLRLTLITLNPYVRSVSGGPGSDKYVLTQERARSGRLSTIVVSGSPSQGFTFSHSRERKQGFEHNPNEAPHGFLWSIGRHGMRVLQGTLMPAGYPSSVNPGFAAYAGWQGVTNLAVTTNMVMASTFLLYSVGLSAGTAIPTAGALNWVLKDGLGQLGTLVLGKTVAHNFDVHSKSWFFISTAMLTAAIGLEISTIILPQHFLILGSLAGMIKGLAFMASSSTRSVFNLSFVRDNNIADLTAKGTSQYICASLFGTLIGSTLCSWVGQDTYTAGACFLALSAVTLYGAFATVKTIPLPTLNSTRLQLLTESFLSASAAASRHQRRQSRTATTYGTPQRSDSSLVHHHTAQDAGLDYHDYVAGPELEPMWAGDPLVGSATESENLYDEYLDPRVPSPAQLAAEDPPLPFLMGDQRLLNPAILVGESLERVLEDVGPELVVLLLTTYRLSHAIVLPRGPAVHILLHQQATPRDICQGYLQACLLRRRMRAGSTVGLAAAQHAIEVQAAARRQQERQAAAAEAAEAAAAAGDGSQGGLQPHSHQPQGYDDAMADSEELCVVRGSASPALADLRIILQDTLQTAERLVTPFMRSMEAAGWRLEKVVVEAEKRRAHW